MSDPMADARLHVEHADVVLTVCAYPPMAGSNIAPMTAACSVGDDLPPYVLAEVARVIITYGKDLAAEADRRMGMAHN